MAFVTNVFARYGIGRSISCYANYSSAVNLATRRWFSEKSFPVGSSPTDILKVGDPGFEYFSQNVEIFRQSGRVSYLTPEQMASLDQLPASGVNAFKKILKDLARSNEALFGQIKQVDAKVTQLLSSLKNQ